MSASWSDLPEDILQLIFHKLRLPSDVLQCAIVCVSWQSAIRPLYQQHKAIFHGLLLLSGRKKRESKYCNVFNSESCQVSKILLPEIQGRWFSGTTYGGWMLTIGNGTRNEIEIHLLNPFTRARIRLPTGKRFKSPEFTRLESKKPEITRVIASTSPANPSCKLLAVHPGKHTYQFSFCRLIDQGWVSINNFVGRCCDAIFYNGEFYVVDSFGCLWLIQSEFQNGCYPKAVKLDIILVSEYHYQCYYMVEVGGDLCLVVRDAHFSCTFSRFAFYRMDWCTKTWVWVRHFGDYAVYLGRFGSLSQATGKQETSGASFRKGQQKASCIHFIDDHTPEICSPGCRYSMSMYYSAKGQYFRCILNGPSKTAPISWIVPDV